jgi:hypothetical protein
VSRAATVLAFTIHVDKRSLLFRDANSTFGNVPLSLNATPPGTAAKRVQGSGPLLSRLGQDVEEHDHRLAQRGMG